MKIRERQFISDSKSPNICTFNTINVIGINTVNIELKLQKKTIVKGILGMLSYE